MVTYDIISWGGAMMNYRKYKSNPKELLEQGRAIARQKGNDAKFQRRVEIVNLVLSGHSPSELSKDMGCHINTIMRWVKAADEQGFESLQDGKHTGRPLRLSESQLQDIDNAVETWVQCLGRSRHIRFYPTDPRRFLCGSILPALGQAAGVQPCSSTGVSFQGARGHRGTQ